MPARKNIHESFMPIFEHSCSVADIPIGRGRPYRQSPTPIPSRGRGVDTMLLLFPLGRKADNSLIPIFLRHYTSRPQGRPSVNSYSPAVRPNIRFIRSICVRLNPLGRRPTIPWFLCSLDIDFVIFVLLSATLHEYASIVHQLFIKNIGNYIPVVPE